LVGFKVLRETKLVIELTESTEYIISLSAKVAVELAKSRLIQTAVLLHPAFLSVDDFKGMDFQYLHSFLLVF